MWAVRPPVSSGGRNFIPSKWIREGQGARYIPVEVPYVDKVD